MSKKMCSDHKKLQLKMGGENPRFYCKKCGKRATREKWVCKPKAI